MARKKKIPETDFSHITHQKKRDFLTAFAECGTVTYAARAAGISRRTVYTDQWQGDEDFKQAFDQAREMGADKLEAEAIRRAMESSDTLLIFMLKGLRPERFRERYEHKHEHSGGVMVVEAQKSEDAWITEMAERRAAVSGNGRK